MPDDSFKQQLRKKVIELKADSAGFYTETYNLVSVMIRLSSDAPELVRERMSFLYKQPSRHYKLSLPQLETIYFRYKDELSLKIKGGLNITHNDVKIVLDRVRRDCLFIWQ